MDALAIMQKKDWAELQGIEHNGALYFPDVLLRRRKDGTVEEIPVMLKPLREYEKRQARIKARAWAAEEKLDADKDGDLFDNLDTLCQLWLGVRSATPPYEPYEMEPKRLDRNYDRAGLEQLFAKLEAYSNLVDPRESEITREGVIALAASVVARRNIAPLLAFDGRSQSDFIIGMAEELLNCLASTSSSESSEHSTPEI